MATEHLELLFSEAYDGALRDPDQRHFDAHLDACERCRRAYADYRAALDAVHDLPRARMPVTVVLPASAPAMEPGMTARWRALLAGTARPRPLGAATALAVTGIAAVVLVSHLHTGAGGSPSSLAFGSSSTADTGPGQHNAAVAAPGASVCGSGIPFGVAASGVTPPAGFGVSTTTSAGGSSLVVAIQSAAYHPGDRVLVYARMTTAPASGQAAPAAGAPGGGGALAAIVPCVALEAPGSKAFSAGATSAQAAAGAAAAPLPAPLADADRALGASSAQLLSLTIPPGTPRGTTLVIVAVVPPGTNGVSGDIPAPAVLTITVS